MPDLLPRWTERVVTNVGGRDPLGASRFSAELTRSLFTVMSPGDANEAATERKA